MPRPKDPERAETEARLQQAIAEYKKMTKTSPKRQQILSPKCRHRLQYFYGDLVEWEKKPKKRKTTRTKKDERWESKDEQESIDESEASQNERLPVLDCIEVRKENQ